MTVKLIITVLTILFGVSQMSCAKEEAKGVVVEEQKEATQGDLKADSIRADAEEVQKEIEEIVNEAINQPTEYDIPEDVSKIMQQLQASFNVWNTHIGNHNKVIKLMQTRIETCQANQAHDATSMKYTIREYLLGQGVPMEDLGNWKPVGNKIVRVNQNKETK